MPRRCVGQSGQQFGISGAGADLFTGTDAYSTIYAKGAVGNAATVTTEVTSQQNMTGFAKAGIIVRNDVDRLGHRPGGRDLVRVAVRRHPRCNGTRAAAPTSTRSSRPTGPSRRACPSGSNWSATARPTARYYSFDGSDWLAVGDRDRAQARRATQDGRHVPDVARRRVARARPCSTASARRLARPPRPRPPPTRPRRRPTRWPAGPWCVELLDLARAARRSGFVGNGGTLTFSNISAAQRSGTLIGGYIPWCTARRPAGLCAWSSANGGPPQGRLSFASTGSFNTTGTMTVSLPLKRGRYNNDPAR